MQDGHLPHVVVHAKRPGGLDDVPAGLLGIAGSLVEQSEVQVQGRRTLYAGICRTLKR